MELYSADEPIKYVCFLESGVGSIVGPIKGREAENGLFGREGFAPVAAVLTAKAPGFSAVMQMPGFGYRIPAAPFLSDLAKNEAARSILLRYVQAHLVQIAQTALSNAVHVIEERLARWILMIHDRIDDDEFAITHDFLSLMLAVRRPSVTTALHALEGEMLIRAERGCIIVRDRRGLEERAGDAYGYPEAEYEELLAPSQDRFLNWSY